MTSASLVGTDSKHEDIIYYDVVKTNTTDRPIKATFNAQLTVPLLDQASLFTGSIVRFSLPGTAFPILIFKPNTYKISLRRIPGFPGVSFAPAFVNLVTNVDPNEAKLFPDFANFVYDYQVLVDSINTTIRALWVPFIAANPGVATEPPWISYDPATTRFSIIGETKSYSSASEAGAGGNQLLFNEPLMSLFPNFISQEHLTLGTATNPDLTNEWTALPLNRLGNNTIPAPAGVGVGIPMIIEPAVPNLPIAAAVNAQTYSSLASLLDIRGIMITTSNIPARSEVIPGLVNSTGADVGNIGSPASLNIISDYVLLSSDGVDFATGIVYNPTAEFRYFDLTGDGPLNSMDFQILWYTGQNALNPVYIYPGEVFTIKTMFKRKHEHASAAMAKTVENVAEQIANADTGQPTTAATSFTPGVPFSTLMNQQ